MSLANRTNEELFNQTKKINGISNNVDRVEDPANFYDDFLDQNEKLLKLILENALIGVAILNLDLTFKTVNKTYSDILGYSREELQNLKITEIIYQEDIEKSIANLDKILKSELSEIKSEKRHVNKNGNIIIAITRSWVIYNNNEPQYIIETIDDISEQRRIEYEIKLLANALKSISECISITDMQDIIIFVNDAFLRTYGYERDELVGKNIDLVRSANNSPSLTEKILPATLNGGWQGEILNKRKNGQEFPIHLSTSIINDENGKPIALIGISVDITEQKRLQTEIQKAHRLEAIGTLAGGIAHDFNNILVGILGNISLAKIYTSSSEKLFDKLNDMETAALRARELSNKLITFAKGGTPRKRVSSISNFLKDAVLNSLTGSNSNAEFMIQNDLWKVEYDEGQLRQVISNIIINAVESMPGGGQIILRSENLILPAESGYPLPQGQYIKITIKDHGIGIPADNLDRIFDPFFSTKFLGRGIGLSTAYSIIKKHNGYIKADSKIGEGTEISIYLPAHSEKSQESINKDSRIKLRNKIYHKILVMDDEKIVREFIEEFLTYSGFEVGLAENGEEAIRLFIDAKNSGSPFEIAILDLTVPKGLGAKETFEKLYLLDPGIKAIIASGYSNDKIISDYKSFGFKGALTKPFKIEEIDEVLRKVIDE